MKMVRAEGAIGWINSSDLLCARNDSGVKRDRHLYLEEEWTGWEVNPQWPLPSTKSSFSSRNRSVVTYQTMTFSLAYCELVTLLVTVGQLRPRLAAFDNVCQVRTTKEF